MLRELIGKRQQNVKERTSGSKIDGRLRRSHGIKESGVQLSQHVSRGRAKCHIFGSDDRNVHCVVHYALLKRDDGLATFEPRSANRTAQVIPMAPRDDSIKLY